MLLSLPIAIDSNCSPNYTSVSRMDEAKEEGTRRRFPTHLRRSLAISPRQGRVFQKSSVGLGGGGGHGAPDDFCEDSP